MSYGWVRISFSAPIRYGEERPSSRNGHCSACKFWCRGPRVSDRYWSAYLDSIPTESTALISSCLVSAKCLISGGMSVSTRSMTSLRLPT
ncbi:Uncharacterised protein [Mycobacterium tuberculosis]|nr:Uncharacterised protein [Mycobacterium tuberculosis]